MIKKQTRLAYLMSRLKIKSKVLAESTKIDDSLISRWRKGHRKLNPASHHAEKIAAYLLLCDKDSSIIATTMHMYGLDETTGTLLENLTFWICEDYLPEVSLKREIAQQKSEYTASFRVFLGDDGLRSGVITLLDYVMTLPPNQTVLAVVRSNYNWMVSSPSFLKTLLQRLEIAVKRGTTMIIVLRDDFRVSDIELFAGPWLVAHLKGYVKSVYYKGGTEFEAEKVTAVVEDKIGFRLCEDMTVADNLYIGMYTDPITVRQIYSRCTPYQELAKPHFQYNFFEMPADILPVSAPETTISKKAYLLQRVPGIGSLSIEDITTNNQLSEGQIERCRERFKALFATPADFERKQTVRHIYSLEAIEMILSTTHSLDHSLSKITGKRIYTTKTNLIKQLKNIRFWLLNFGYYQVIFAPNVVFEKVNMEYSIVKDTYGVAWLPNSTQSTCVTESDMTNALYGFANSVWEKIPRVYKSKKRTIQKIDALIKKYDV